jgi:hypothetical protein
MDLSSLTLGIANRISQISDLQFEMPKVRCLLPPGFTLGRPCVVAFPAAAAG